MISVVVPVFDVEPWLGACLESLAAQTLGDFEAIVVDDGSTDGSAGAAERFAARDARFRVVRAEHGGLASARNEGLSRVRGEWIAFVDSDDAVAPDYLESLLSAAERSGAEIACCGKRAFAGEPPRVAPAAGPRPFETLSGPEAAARALRQSDAPDYSAWGKLYSAAFWGGRRFPARRRFEDMALVPGVLADARRVAFVRDGLYLYRRRADGLLGTALASDPAELLEIAEGLERSVGSASPELAAAARANLLSACFSVLLRSPRSPENGEARERARRGILRLRAGVLLDPRSRLKNRAACLLSFAGLGPLEALFGRNP